MLNYSIKKPVFRWLFLCFTISHLLSCDAQKQQANNESSIKLITLSPHLAELVASAGALDNLIGVVTYSDFPEQVKSIQLVGDAFKVDYEEILRLKADYVLTWKGGTPLAVIEKLKSLNIKTINIEIKDLSDIPKAILKIGALTHTNKQAKKTAEQFSIKLSQMKALNHPKLSTFIETYHQPLYTVSGNHWMSEAAAVCGYNNIFNDLKQSSVTVTLESVILKNPQVIINIAKQADNQWLKWKDLDAVKNNNIMTLDPDIISRPSMRILQGIEVLCRENTLY
jgi:ABC-type Fe3+-hydroxamate transport system substrate-binding protein